MVAKQNNHENIGNDALWYADIGASHHITPNLTNLQLSNLYSGNETIQVGNNLSLDINHIGSNIVTNDDCLFRLNNVLHCLNAPFNLLSIKSFSNDNNCAFKFDNNDFFIKDKLMK
jgi:hypothetical protein